ncbi:hypothetical protein HHK36_016389 [Tetracentron sinense]|uniref:TFIIS N-terminal domain-containing protein n=1 Tax=Tetracentron sinense TaxID=13715 RepID=A0A835DE61_TETSI|nr:hypothetical protein HHK36_016389 [Tetracentron sinense]
MVTPSNSDSPVMNPPSGDTSNKINDVSSPYFLHSSDHPGTILVSSLLIGENYPTWKRAMRMALNAKNKLGFVDGSLKKPAPGSSELQTWERCNDMVLSWILNAIDKTLTNSIIYGGTPRNVWLDLEERFSQSNNPRIFHLKRAICNLQQDQQSLVSYYNTLKSYWDELATHTVIPECTCGAFKELKSLQETERLYQFLMGLNDTYSHIRSQILAMDQLPTVSKAYAIINQEEKQRLLHLPSQNSGESIAMTVHARNQITPHGNQPFRDSGSGRGCPYCDHCRVFGHIKAKCYKIVGYPTNWGRTKKANAMSHPMAHTASMLETSAVDPNHDVATTNGTSATQSAHATNASIPLPSLSTDQYQQLLTLLNANGNVSTANLAGSSSFFFCSSASTSPPTTWIIDSGASDHMTPTLSSFTSPTPTPNAKPVKLPTGDVTPITHVGSVNLSQDLALHNVLCVPNFHFNLLSISKLTQTLNCAAIFFPTFCVFQDLASRKLIGAGEHIYNMGYENDPYIDEDGEPLMDDMPSDREESIEPEDPDEDWRRERSPTPVYDSDTGSKAKPRKRLIKKSGKESTPDFDAENEAMAFVGEDSDDEPSSSSYKRKDSKDGGRGKKDKKFKSDGKLDKGFKLGSKGASYGSSNDQGGDPEMKEMWDTIAGADSEDDQEGVRNVDDDNFIDDTGVDPADRFGSDNEAGYAGDAPQAEEGEEDDEIKELFKVGKKKKKSEKSAAEIALLVEHLMAELEVTAEEDAELNRQSKPAINKLKKLPLLTEVLSKKQLQLEFLDHGVLTLLKNWLEPLPDGSLPNINIRTAILKILTDFPIDLDQYDRREQLKKSGLGKVIMFLSRSDEETTSSRKLAKDLVDKWSRPIFNKSTRFEDMRNFDDEKVPFRRPSLKKPVTKAAGLESRDDDLDLAEFSQEPKSSQSSSRQHASRPEALPLDFLVRPQSKIDPDEIRARAKQVVHDQRRLKMNKKLQQLKAPKKKQLQATKLSVEGRGMVKFL